MNIFILNRYNVHLGDARSFGIKKSMIAGTGMGFVFFVIFLVYALAFWYGAKLVREDPHYTVGKMIIVSIYMSLIKYTCIKNILSSHICDEVHMYLCTLLSTQELD